MRCDGALTVCQVPPSLIARCNPAPYGQRQWQKVQNKDSNKLINQVGSEFKWSPEGIAIHSGSLHPSTMQRKRQTNKTSWCCFITARVPGSFIPKGLQEKTQWHCAKMMFKTLILTWEMVWPSELTEHISTISSNHYLWKHKDHNGLSLLHCLYHKIWCPLAVDCLPSLDSLSFLQEASQLNHSSSKGSAPWNSSIINT